MSTKQAFHATSQTAITVKPHTEIGTRPIFFDTDDAYTRRRLGLGIHGTRARLGDCYGEYAGEYTVTAKGITYRYEATESDDIIAIQCDAEWAKPITDWINDTTPSTNPRHLAK